MKTKVPVLVVAALLMSGCGYNTIQTMDENVEQMEGNIDAELQRRNDLIPNLVATVEEVARFEQETQVGVAQARSGLVQSQQRMSEALQSDAPTPELAQANAELQRNLRLFINVAVEAYPTLRANENFTRLQDELTETENRISVSRRDFNESVTTYNTYIRRFPQVLTAKVIGADRRDQFEAAEGAEQAPRVEFGR